MHLVRVFIKKKEIALTLGIAIDYLFGDPKSNCHPIVGFSKAMASFEKKIYDDSRANGLIYLAFGLMLSYCSAKLIRKSLLLAGVFIGLLIARKTLLEVAGDIHESLKDGNLEKARELVSQIVTRDCSFFEEEDIARATIESVSENMVDAVAGPIICYLFGGLEGLMLQRALDTLDSLVGYKDLKNKNFGYFSAKAEDYFMYLPARLSFLLLIISNPSKSKKILKTYFSYGRNHPSLNAGLAESAYAAILGVNLGGPDSYLIEKEQKPEIKAGRTCTKDDILKLIQVANRHFVYLLFAYFGLTLTKRKFLPNS